MKTKQKSEHALCAQEIRKLLKKFWPNTKFSVTSESYSMGNSVSINWTDGPTYKSVKELVNMYQYGNFNSMEDCYDITNRDEGIPQVKHVLCSRDISDGVLEDYARKQASKYDIGYQSLWESNQELMAKRGYWTWGQLARHELSDTEVNK